MFITLEGIEGSGKTSQAEAVVAFLTDRGHRCLLTREPGGTRIGRQIRSILLDPENRDVAPAAELLLYMADRAQHIQTLIHPALQSGQTVICDRYVDATVVYQGYARGLNVEGILRLHEMVLGGLKPDLTVVLDLAPETGLARAWRQISSGERTGSESRFEKEDLDFHRKIREGYLDLARQQPDRIRVVDADRPPERVREDILRILAASLGPRPAG